MSNAEFNEREFERVLAGQKAEYAKEILAVLDREIQPRLYMHDFEKNEYGEGYDCCGCSTYGEIYESVCAVIRRLGGLSEEST